MRPVHGSYGEWTIVRYVPRFRLFLRKVCPELLVVPTTIGAPVAREPVRSASALSKQEQKPAST